MLLIAVVFWLPVATARDREVCQSAVLRTHLHRSSLVPVQCVCVSEGVCGRVSEGVSGCVCDR